MRIRTIKPDFWPHRMHSRISEPAALLAIGLLNLADDEGRFEADPQAILNSLFPRRQPSKPIVDCLNELRTARWIVLYDGLLDGQKTQIGQITKFKRHQVINKFRASNLPAPPPELLREDYGSTTVALPSQTKEADGSTPATKETSETSTNQVALPPSQEGKGGERKEEKEPRESGSDSNLPEAEIPSLSDVLAYCRIQAIKEETGREFWEHYEKTAYPSWTNGGGKRFQWRGKLHQWSVKARMGTPGSVKTGNADVEVIQLEAELEGETDPTKRDILKGKIRRLKN